VTCEPRAYSAWTCIVGCRSEPEIAKPFPQFAQITRRMAQRLDRIERIGETAPVGGARHKLRDALGAFAAHSAGIETTFLPDHAGKKLDGKRVLRRRLLQRTADLISCEWFRGQRLGSAWCARLRRPLVCLYGRSGAYICSMARGCRGGERICSE
jgi:hypothetical protein